MWSANIERVCILGIIFTYRLDPENFEGVVDFVFRLQLRSAVADEGEQRPSAEQEIRSKDRWSTNHSACHKKVTADLLLKLSLKSDAFSSWIRAFRRSTQGVHWHPSVTLVAVCPRQHLFFLPREAYYLPERLDRDDIVSGVRIRARKVIKK